MGGLNGLKESITNSASFVSKNSTVVGESAAKLGGIVSDTAKTAKSITSAVVDSMLGGGRRMTRHYRNKYQHRAKHPRITRHKRQQKKSKN